MSIAGTLVDLLVLQTHLLKVVFDIFGVSGLQSCSKLIIITLHTDFTESCLQKVHLNIYGSPSYSNKYCEFKLLVPGTCLNISIAGPGPP